ncbi:MAG: alpha-amylase family glycosyl hydrolase [Candidatus Methanofastidiosia archaeon]
MSKIPLRSIHYQWESLLYKEDLSGKETYKQEFGPLIISRAPDKKAEKVKFNLYTTTKTQSIYLIGECNDWGKDEKKLSQFELEKKGNSGFFSIVTKQFSHKDAYLFLVKDEAGTFLLRDPAASLFDDEGNSIFWDFHDPTAYEKKYSSPNTLHRTTKVLQTDVPGLVAKWFEFDSNAKPLAEIDTDIFMFIATCGVLDKVQELGFNTIQFLPVAQSIDGDNWKFRYLVPYPFALQKNWGDPNSFARLIDECHKRGIAVIVDLILSHAPHKDYQLFGLPGENVGLHCWQGHEGDVYLDELTPWGTKRFRYGDMNVRRYLVESALHFLIHYRIDGFRIDNVDGILRFGDA